LDRLPVHTIGTRCEYKLLLGCREYWLQLILPDSLVRIDRGPVRPPLQLLHGDLVRYRGLRHLNLQASCRPDAIDPGVPTPSAENAWRLLQTRCRR
jgi:hypothetical protein